MAGVSNRILRQTRRARWQQNISRSIGPLHIACERNADNGRDPAPVQGISLDDNDRSPKAWSGSRRLRQIGPPNICLANHHSTFSSTRREATDVNSSLPKPTSAHTLFIASVT